MEIRVPALEPGKKKNSLTEKSFLKKSSHNHRDYSWKKGRGDGAQGSRGNRDPSGECRGGSGFDMDNSYMGTFLYCHKAKDSVRTSRVETRTIFGVFGVGKKEFASTTVLPSGSH